MRILVVATLMVLNWAIEAAKWTEAMKIISPVSLRVGLKAIFSGNTLAFFTPNRTGEYLGRMLYLKKDDRLRSIPLTIVCSMAQLMITLIAGLTGLFYIKGSILGRFGSDVTPWLNVAMYLVLAAVIVLTLFYFRIRFLAKWMKGRRWTRMLGHHLTVLEDVNATILTSILSLSVARYVVFIVQ